MSAESAIASAEPRPRFSIIVCSHRPPRAEFIRRHYAAAFDAVPHEIIVIPDARSLCEGYTRGVAMSLGELLVFSHDDVQVLIDDLPERLQNHLSRFDLIGIAGTRRLIDGAWATAGDPDCFALVIYPLREGMCEAKASGSGPMSVDGIQALDGCFFACRRKVAEGIGFDADTFDGFHLYDLDFSFRAHLAGYRLAVCRDIPLYHASMGTPDAVWAIYRERFETKHRSHLSTAPGGPLRVARTEVPTRQLASFAQQEHLQRLVGMLTPAEPTP